MEIEINLVSPTAIEATNIRELKNIKTLVNDIKENGMYEAIKIGKLTQDEADQAYNALAEAEEKRQTDAAAAGHNIRPKTIARPIYGIIDGHTRYMAAAKAKLPLIKVEEIQRRSSADEKMYAYKANIARREMEEWQKGEMIETIKTETGKNVDDIAKAIGWSKAYGYKLLKKLKEHREGNGNQTTKAAAVQKPDMAVIDNLYQEFKNYMTTGYKTATVEETIDEIDKIKEILKELSKAKIYLESDKEVSDKIKEERVAKMKAGKKPKALPKLKLPKGVKMPKIGIPVKNK